MASGSTAMLKEGCTNHAPSDVFHVRPARISYQASAEHFEQCAEFPLLCNRGLGPLAVTRPPTSPIFVTATPRCALSQARPLLWLARRAGAQDFARSTRARACLTPRLPRSH